MIKLCLRASVSALAVSAAAQSAAHAQDAQAMHDVITVTATKRPDAQNVQDVPLAVTAYGADQLVALKVRDIADLSYSMPNVSLDDVGTSKGTANFSIRGLGINSSIPSIDPTVGVFINGVYLGVNNGVVFDTFDLEGIEVLRGPQGVLFGRNVTGGAVLINYRQPDFEPGFDARFAVESGFRGTGAAAYAMGSVTGTLVEDMLAGRLSVYGTNDDGWFYNSTLDTNAGGGQTFLVRPSLLFEPTPRLSSFIQYEYGEHDGDGPAPADRGRVGRDSFDLSYDELGFSYNYWNTLTWRTDYEVDFGSGMITNVFGWRDYSQTTLGDIDSKPQFLFHAPSRLEQDQVSNELRYAGSFGDLELTAGAYVFSQNVVYQETRDLGIAGITLSGGGRQEHETYGAFLHGRYALTSRLSVNVGARYSIEEKDVEVASLNLNVTPFDPAPDIVPAGGCNVLDQSCAFDFVDEDSWESFTPQIGAEYENDRGDLYYARYTRGFRSGGYNLRNTNPLVGPGPFDQETVDSFEGGAKFGLIDGAGTLNVALFHTQISDMQREINEPTPIGNTQVIRNSADASISGFEAELRYLVTDTLSLDASLGYTDGSYDEVRADLTGDGVIDEADLNLDLPRLAELTYRIGVIYDASLGDFGDLTLRTSFSHRDEAAYTDNNLGTLNAGDMLDSSVTWRRPGGALSLSLYGDNLLNDVTEGGDTQLFSGTPLAGSFSPLNKGRVIGLELRVER